MGRDWVFIVNKKARSWEVDVPALEKTVRKLGMAMHTANPSTQGDQELKIILNYIFSVQLAWAT